MMSAVVQIPITHSFGYIMEEQANDLIFHAAHQQLSDPNDFPSQMMEGSIDASALQQPHGVFGFGMPPAGWIGGGTLHHANPVVAQQLHAGSPG